MNTRYFLYGTIKLKSYTTYVKYEHSTKHVLNIPQRRVFDTYSRTKKRDFSKEFTIVEFLSTCTYVRYSMRYYRENISELKNEFLSIIYIHYVTIYIRTESQIL